MIKKSLFSLFLFVALHSWSALAQTSSPEAIPKGPTENLAEIERSLTLEVRRQILSTEMAKATTPQHGVFGPIYGEAFPGQWETIAQNLKANNGIHLSSWNQLVEVLNLRSTPAANSFTSHPVYLHSGVGLSVHILNMPHSNETSMRLEFFVSNELTKGEALEIGREILAEIRENTMGRNGPMEAAEGESRFVKISPELAQEGFKKFRVGYQMATASTPEIMARQILTSLDSLPDFNRGYRAHMIEGQVMKALTSRPTVESSKSVDWHSTLLRAGKK